MAKIETKLSSAQIEIAEALFTASYGVTLGKRSGDAISIPVPVADFPANAIVKIFEYGVQRIFNDKVGGADTSAEEKAEKVRELIEAFAKGEIRATRASGSSDPVLAEVLSLLRPQVKAAIGAETWKTWDESERLAKIEKIFNAQSEEVQKALRGKAEKSLEIKRAAREEKAALSVKIEL